MKPHYANQIFSIRQLELFESLRHCVISLSEKHPVDVSCHELARAAGTRFQLPVVDGHFLVGFEHSWLNLDGHVIDVYPIGHAGHNIVPLLIDRTISRQIVSRAWSKEFLLYDATRKPKGLERVRTDVVVELALEMKGWHGGT